MGKLLKALAALSAVVAMGAAHAGPVSGQGTWESTLKARDINGSAVALSDPNAAFFYDTTLNVTWLANANAGGLMGWANAVAWANTLSIGGFDDWRLPVTLQADTSCSALVNGHYFGYHCTGSEMGHLWYSTLGNVADVISNTGTFDNLMTSPPGSAPYYYWSGTEYSTVSAWQFWQYRGSQFSNNKEGGVIGYAMAVRDGDVCATAPGGSCSPNPAPEPASLALVSAALAGLVAVRRRRSTRT